MRELGRGCHAGADQGLSAWTQMLEGGRGKGEFGRQSWVDETEGRILVGSVKWEEGACAVSSGQ